MKVKAFIIAAMLAIGGLVGVSAPAYAVVTCPAGSLRGGADGTGTAPTYADCNLEEPSEPLMNTVNRLINVVVGVIGVVAVGVIIVGAIFYVISTGEAAKIARAKNTILYGIIGLVIAMLAFAIVNFVLKNVFSPATTPPATTPPADSSETTGE